MKNLLLLVIIGLCVFGAIITHGVDKYQGVFIGVGILASVVIITLSLTNADDL